MPHKSYFTLPGNIRKSPYFVRIAQRLSRKKPIIVVKSGKSSAGSKAASSHTGALTTSETVTQELFRQTGLVRVDGIEELFNVASMLSNQPLPKGKRLVIVTNGGGPGILATDAASKYGLILPEISPEIAAAIKPHLKHSIKMNNPMDTTAAAVPVEFEGILQELAADKGSDAVLFIFVRPAMLKVEEVEAALHRVAAHFRRNKKPLLVCSMGHTGLRAEIGTTGKFIPSYVFPENAVAALAKAVEYSERLARPESAPVKFSDIKREEANKIIAAALAKKIDGQKWLSLEQISGLLKCYGIRFAETKFAKTAADAAAIGGQIGYPVVLKLASSTITHKTDVGGVRLNLKSESDVIDAFKSIKAKLAEIGKETRWTA